MAPIIFCCISPVAWYSRWSIASSWIPSTTKCRDHHQHFELFQDISRNSGWEISSLPLDDLCYHRQRYCPPSKSDLIMLWSSFLSSLCYVLHWSITVLHVKDVVRIAPPLKNSWYSNTSRHLHSFPGSRVDSNRGTNKWTVLFGFCPSSNPIPLKLMVGRSFLDYWLLNHHSDVGRATQPIFRVHLSPNV